jgi:hypothetical protein
MRRIIASSSNWTGRPVFCCTTIARVRIRPPLTRSPTRIFTTSQPRSLLSMARSNSTRSRSRRSRSSQKRIAQTCCGFSALLAPSFRPAFQARRSREAGSYSECPIIVLLSALVGQRELRWMQWRFSLAETGQPLWSTRRQQADVRSGGLPTAAIDPNGTLKCFSARASRRRAPPPHRSSIDPVRGRCSYLRSRNQDGRCEGGRQ